MSDRMQLDVSARMAALHSHISSVNSGHQLTHESGNAAQSTSEAEPRTQTKDIETKRKENEVI